jgi:hypothetical protein
MPWSRILLAAIASGVAARAGAEAPLGQGDELARGFRVMKDFCLSCHVLEPGQGGTPLRPRLRPEAWGDPERAFANLGNLSAINPRMDQPFRGGAEERRLLALALAAIARENRVPAWRAALPYASMAAGVAVAAGFLAWARRRGGRP